MVFDKITEFRVSMVNCGEHDEYVVEALVHYSDGQCKWLQNFGSLIGLSAEKRQFKDKATAEWVCGNYNQILNITPPGVVEDSGE